MAAGGGHLQRDSLKLHQCRKARWQRKTVVSLGRCSSMLQLGLAQHPISALQLGYGD